MKQLIFLFCIAAVSCCGTKKNPVNVNGTKSAAIQIPVSEKPSPCLDQLISRYTQEEKQNPPERYTVTPIWVKQFIMLQLLAVIFLVICLTITAN